MSDDLFAIMKSLDDAPSVREDFIRAPFAFPGGKSFSLPQLLPHLPYRDGYCEPFGGSGSVLLARNESHFEVYNDRYAGVVAFYRCVRDKTKLDALINRMTLCLHSREEFIWCKSTWKDCEDDVERAARWYYMTIMSFNAKGTYFGRSLSKKAKLSPRLSGNLLHFYPVHFRLKNVLIENLDWRECFKDYDSSSMVWYLDPTYFDYAKGLYEHEMSKDCHLELCERIQHLQGFVALSGYDNPLYNRYSWDNKIQWRVPVKTLGMAFTESNNLIGLEDTLKRGYAIETLWIRESKS